MKKNLIIAGSILAFFFILGISKDLIVKVAVEKGVEVVTGLKLNMSAFRVGIFNSVVDIRDLKLFNPSGFQDRTMVDMPQIYVAYDLPSMFTGKVHLKKVSIYLKEFVVVKNKDGKLNLNSLKVVQAQKEGKKPAEKTEKEGGKAPEIQIDTLRLKIGKAIYKDYTASPSPRVQEFNINIDDEYKNIDNPYSIVSLIVVKTLSNTAISSLANFDVQGLKGTVSDTLSTIQKVNPQAFQGAVKAAQQATQSGGDVSEAAKSAADTVQNAFKGAFNSGK